MRPCWKLPLPDGYLKRVNKDIDAAPEHKQHRREVPVQHCRCWHGLRAARGDAAHHARVDVTFQSGVTIGDVNRCMRSAATSGHATVSTRAGLKIALASATVFCIVTCWRARRWRLSPCRWRNC